jgi:hypothetical protein
MFWMQKRASYFFVLDVFIGSAVLVLVLVIIFSSRVNSPQAESPYKTADEFMTFISTTQFRDVGNPHKLNLTREGYINDTSMTVLETIMYLKYLNVYNTTNPMEFGAPWANVYAESVIQGIIPPQYGVNFSVNGSTVYLRNPKGFQRAQLVLSSRRIDYIRVSGADGNVVPVQFVAEVKLWS